MADTMAHGEIAGPSATHHLLHPLRIAVVAMLLLVCFSLAYMALGPEANGQPGDSLLYISGVETIGIASIRGNHPLGHLVLNAAFLTARHLGYQGRALPVCQAFTNLVGGMIVSFFFLSSVTIFRNSMRFSAVMAFVLGVSASSWLYLGNTADIYSFAFLFSLIAWSALVYELYALKRQLLLLSGLAIGLAILSHQLNALLLPAGFVLIWIGGRDRVQRMMSLLAVTGLTVVLGYAVIWFGIVSSTPDTALLDWIRGYVGQPAWGRYFDWAWVQTAWTNATGALVFAGWDSLKFRLARTLLMIPMGLTLLFGLARLRSLDSWRQHVIAAASVELGVCFLLVLWWEPQNGKFWALALAPFLVMITAMAQALEECGGWLRSFLPRPLWFSPTALLFLTVIGLTLFNVYTVAIPTQKGDNQGDIWLVHSEEDDLVFPPWMVVPYLQFWADRPNAMNLDPVFLVPGRGSRAALSILDQRISNTLCSHHSVLFSPTTIDLFPDEQFAQVGASKKEWWDFFDRYRWEERFSYPWGEMTVHVYSLQSSSPCP